MKNFKYILLGLVIILGLAYLLGPKPDFEMVSPELPNLTLKIHELEDFIALKDAKIKDLKPGTESKIVWMDEAVKSKTEFVVVYLHGFSATGEEGGDIHEEFAAHFGANLYVPRLYDSGRSSIETFRNLTPKQMMDSAKEAISVGKLLGDKIILMSCSTGSTYSSYLASFHKEIHSLFMYSPNIDLEDDSSNAILYPWGASIMKQIVGSEYYVVDGYNEQQKIHWNEKYHTDGIIALKFLIHQTMKKEIFQKITQPTFVSYYYKNDQEKDEIVSIDRIEDFYAQIATPEDQKRKFVCADCMDHVISSKMMNDNVGQVLKQSIQFAEEILGLKPIYTGVLVD